MKVMIYNPSARIGGALSVLQDLKKKTVNIDGNVYYYIIGIPCIEQSENTRVFYFPWVNYTWIHRLFFDYIVAPWLVRKLKIDKVISLQNLTVPFVNIPQVLYLQQPLPFTPYKFSIRDNTKLWFYQNIIGQLVKASVRKATEIHVQSGWMKTACVKNTGISEEKVSVMPPFLDKSSIKFRYCDSKKARCSFFYPSSGLYYKNHCLIVEACLRLKQKFPTGYKVFFTLGGNENANIIKLHEIVRLNNLPIVFLGQISRDTVYQWYTKSTLIFPSYVETYGLPLLEASICGAPILASSCPFSYEILENYEDARFFDPFDANQLAELMALNMEKMI